MGMLKLFGLSVQNLVHKQFNYELNKTKIEKLYLQIVWVGLIIY